MSKVLQRIVWVLLLPIWLPSEIWCRAGTALVMGIDRVATLPARLLRSQ